MVEIGVAWAPAWWEAEWSRQPIHRKGILRSMYLSDGQEIAPCRYVRDTEFPSLLERLQRGIQRAVETVPQIHAVADVR